MKITSLLFMGLYLALATSAVGQNKGKGKGKKGPKAQKSLLTVRGDYKTKLIRKTKSEDPIDVPPEDSVFKVVKYPTKIGDMSAYLTKKPELKKNGKVPAIVWLTGGIPCAGAGSYLWEDTKIDNEQSARIYRLRGVAMMFPTVRGTKKENPGTFEGFYGEVDDVIAAGKYLKSLDYIDPKRVYLGGHSGGGTLALLTATATNQFAGVISLGPTEDHYGEEESPFEWNEKEIGLRSPIKHIDKIRTPTYIIEGFDDGYSVNQLKKASKNPLVECVLVSRADHFNVIHPVNSVFSDAILASKDGKLTFEENEISQCYMVASKRRREASDLESLAKYRRKGVDFEKPQEVTFYLLSGTKDKLKDIGGPVFKKEPITAHTSSKGSEYFVLRLKKEMDLTDLKKVFAASKIVSDAAYWSEVTYDDWVIQ